jgi:hypothetical protein
MGGVYLPKFAREILRFSRTHPQFVLFGNVYDIYPLPQEGGYVPLPLSAIWGPSYGAGRLQARRKLHPLAGLLRAKRRGENLQTAHRARHHSKYTPPHRGRQNHPAPH